MRDLIKPILAAEDELTNAPDIDYNAILAPLVAQRGSDPILRAPMASDVESLVNTQRPETGNDLNELLDEINHAFETYPRKNTHPGFFGWIAPSGLPTDPLTHAIVAAINDNVGGFWSAPVGTVIEKSVVRWLAELAGMPAYTEGILISGGSMANMTAIAAALADRFGEDYRKRGLLATGGSEHVVIICSQAAHFSIRRAAAMLGVGTDNVVTVETDDQFRIRLDKLADALEQHKNVACVVASAGTTNTGAIDPLEEVSRLCKKHSVWFHVDAAYGGGGLMSDELKPRYKGIEKADSVIMDLHKWFFQSLDGSVLLYRDASAARKLFFESSDYLQATHSPTPEDHMFFHLSPELSRRLRALPFYVAFRHYGFERLGRNALHNVQCAEYLAALIEREENLELVTAPQLSILNYRFVKSGMSDIETDKLNSAIRQQIQSEGNYLMSATQVNGRPVLRVSIINHATRAEHIEGLVASVLRIGRSLA